ncbi:DUF1517 domain-containing protein [Pseudanabaenaceae cyanobacterium LEGE 13415]|nr:DUF1517 domain-containing protein [Pseudanabaenaceae cyanobacterium LEGE 13415]
MPFRSSEMLIDSAAYAKRSGGRSGGGSFNRSSGSSNRNSGSDPGGSVAPRSPGGGVFYGGYGGGYYGGGGIILLIVALMLIGGTGFFIWYLLKSGKNKGNELENDTVTVTKVQVGLLAEGRAIQLQLAEIVQQAETETLEGLHAELQEATLALLRMPENWSHVQASSQTVKTRDEAEKAFNQLSIAERTKYTTETLTNANGKLVQKEFELDPDKEPASYIVVTLLIGTADDKPLFSEIRTTEALKDVLYQLSSLNLDYLMRFELQWTPQVEGDSLTYDEMLLEYPEMLQI